MTSDKERIEELRHKAELALKTFKQVAKEINDAGFNLQAQADDTVYVYRHHLEEYGVRLQEPAGNVLRRD